MDDAALLAGLLSAAGLVDVERDAFAGMLARLRRWTALTEPQRSWAQTVAARVGLAGVQAPAEPLGKAPSRAAWDPSGKTRRMTTGKLERYAAELSREIRAVGRRRVRT